MVGEELQRPCLAMPYMVDRIERDGSISGTPADRGEYSLVDPKGVGPCFQRKNRGIRIECQDHLLGRAPPSQMRTKRVDTQNLTTRRLEGARSPIIRT